MSAPVEDRALAQAADFPVELAGLVDRMSYKAGWTFGLTNIDRGQGSAGLTFTAISVTPDSYHPEQTRRVTHYFPAPPAAYDVRSWRRWLLDCLLLIEQHEACEFFMVGDHRPFAPHHGPGNNPYTIFEHGTDEDVRTSFRGDVKPTGGE